MAHLRRLPHPLDTLGATRQLGAAVQALEGLSLELVGEAESAALVERTAALEAIGAMPLPPYIHERLQDPERYQTVYAREPGAVAAPTAGLHFDEAMLEALKRRGVGLAAITLHVGAGTFAPSGADEPLPPRGQHERR